MFFMNEILCAITFNQIMDYDDILSAQVCYSDIFIDILIDFLIDILIDFCVIYFRAADGVSFFRFYKK